MVAKQPRTIYNVYHRGGAAMDVVISKWGNSSGIRLPMSVTKALGARVGDRLSYEIKGDAVVFQKKKTAEQMYEDFYGKPFSEITTEDLGAGGELDWGEDVGGEIVL